MVFRGRRALALDAVMAAAIVLQLLTSRSSAAPA